MPDALTIILSVPAIVALVELLKGLGLPTRLAPLAAVVVGVGLALAVYFLAAYGWFGAAVDGLLLALAAAGLYDLAPHQRKTAVTVVNNSAPTGHRPPDPDPAPW